MFHPEGSGGASNLDAYTSPTVEEGIQKGIDKLQERWPEAHSELKNLDVDLEKLDKALVSGNYGKGKYNTSEHGDAYGTFIGTEMVPSILDRFNTVLYEEYQMLEETETNIDKQLQMISEKEDYEGAWDMLGTGVNYLYLKLKKSLIEDKKEKIDNLYNEMNGIETSKE